MNMMELLTVPGMSGKSKMLKLRKDSQKRMRVNLVAQRRAAAAMSVKKGGGSDESKHTDGKGEKLA